MSAKRILLLLSFTLLAGCGGQSSLARQPVRGDVPIDAARLADARLAAVGEGPNVEWRFAKDDFVLDAGGEELPDAQAIEARNEALTALKAEGGSEWRGVAFGYDGQYGRPFGPDESIVAFFRWDEEKQTLKVHVKKTRLALADRHRVAKPWENAEVDFSVEAALDAGQTPRRIVLPDTVRMEDREVDLIYQFRNDLMELRFCEKREKPGAFLPNRSGEQIVYQLKWADPTVGPKVPPRPGVPH